jgi:glyoxylase-like metal-dependent hydrolase (beta-lactamase superfamily II)
LDKRPLRFIILSDANLDRILAGNWLDGAVIAQAATAAQIAAYLKRPSPPLLERLSGSPITPDEALPHPQISFDKQMRLWLGDWEIVLEHCPGPMAGGLIVRLPHARALFSGDLIMNRADETAARPSIAAETNLDQWRANLNRIIDGLQPEDTVLPGRGAVGNRATAVAFASRLERLALMDNDL